MLILSEIHESTYLFELFRGKIPVKVISVSEKNIVTSEDLPDFKDKRLTIILKYDGAKLKLESNKSVLVNGVEYRKRFLKNGDILALGPYRLIFKGKFQPAKTEIKSAAARVDKKIRIKYKLPSAALILEAAAVVASISFFWFCTTQRPVQKGTASSQQKTTAQEHETPPSPTEKIVKPEIPESGAVKKEPVHLVMYSPSDRIVPEKLDILFIHAHPDDETLDYGLYIARASEKGKKIGVLTFTDGESGFDLYPERDTDGIYPDKELSGRELAAVRIKEEENALKVLGADIYLRLGLKNRPYTAEEVKKPLPTLIEEWGGEDFLVRKLNGIFSVLNPDIIVSPDGPCEAHEHFEHEAVGYISDLAVSVYQENNPGKLRAYLKLVDVQQTGVYTDMILLSVGLDSSMPYITKKKQAALLQYQTQADASYYGIKRLKNFPGEYYFVKYQKGETTAGLLLDSGEEKILSTNSMVKDHTVPSF